MSNLEGASVTTQLADTALSIKYSEIPEDVVEVAKLVIIDAIACALGGYHSPTGRIVREFAERSALHARGIPGKGLSEAELDSKFRTCAEPVLGTQAAADVLEPIRAK